MIIQLSMQLLNRLAESLGDLLALNVHCIVQLIVNLSLNDDYYLPNNLNTIR